MAPASLVLSIRVLLQKGIEKRNKQVQTALGRPVDIPGFDANGQFGNSYESVYSLQSHLEEFPPADLLGK